MKVRDDLSNILDVAKFLSKEMENKRSKNIILSLGYRPTNVDSLTFEKQLKKIFSKNSIASKGVILTGELNINLNINLLFYFNFGIISTVNIVTRITQRTATAINQIVLKRSYKS